MKFIYYLLILFLSSKVFALETDKNEPLQISADHVFLNHATGINRYEGRVTLIQGTSELTATTMQVTLDHHNQLKKILATGIPARYRTLFDKTKPQIIATADNMEYYPQTHTLILIDHASVTEGENRFCASRIEYNIKEKTVTCATTPQGQIHITLAPQNGSILTK